MKKLILASVSGLALMGLAACSDTDDTTTQTVPDQEAPMAQPEAAPADPVDPPLDEPAPAPVD